MTQRHLLFLFQTTDPVMSKVREICQVMEQLNYGFNSLCYVLCSEKFREQFLIVLRPRSPNFSRGS